MAAARSGARIGILGGSFNPAHEGHLHISRLALKRLALDQLWWMVSPQNPLKPAAGMAPFAERLASARSLARHPRILVTDIEARLNTRYTADTLCTLRATFPRARFVWIMGADNLRQIPKWERWTDIFRAVPVAVFDRATYSFGALAGKAAHRFRRFRVRPGAAAGLADRRAPAWVYLHTPLHPASATEIRKAATRRSAGPTRRKRSRPAKAGGRRARR